MPVRPRHCIGYERALVAPLAFAGKVSAAARSQETTRRSRHVNRTSGEVLVAFEAFALTL